MSYNRIVIEILDVSVGVFHIFLANVYLILLLVNCLLIGLGGFI